MLGSTIVLIFEAPLDFAFSVQEGQKIKVGEPIGEFHLLLTSPSNCSSRNARKLTSSLSFLRRVSQDLSPRLLLRLLDLFRPPLPLPLPKPSLPIFLSFVQPVLDPSSFRFALSLIFGLLHHPLLTSHAPACFFVSTQPRTHFQHRRTPFFLTYLSLRIFITRPSCFWETNSSDRSPRIVESERVRPPSLLVFP